MNVLVTGGAGYVGSVVTEKLLACGHKAVVLDNLQQGHRKAVLPGVDFVKGDISSARTLERVLQQFKIDAVMHMAAETVVEFSMSDPKRYFHNNIIGGISLLDAMLKQGVNKIIFSSSAAVYGEPDSIPITEENNKLPVNSYGETKLMFEKVLAWYGRAYGIRHISMRYFNACGATKLLGEDHVPETHLIPLVLNAALKGSEVCVFGTDYPTRDGSCLRDYVHVSDIAQAHCLALDRLEAMPAGQPGMAFNLGNGDGCSVLEVVNVVKKISHKDFRVKLAPRRAGDPAVLVASSSKAKSVLGWKPEFPELEAIIESAFRWTEAHPNGYR